MIGDAGGHIEKELHHTQLVSRLARLRDAAWEAVVFNELSKLEHIAISCAKLGPTWGSPD